MSVHDEITSELHVFQGNIFKEIALPFQGSAESGIFRRSVLSSGVWIAAAALTGFNLKPGDEIRFELYVSDSAKGPFCKQCTVAAMKGPGIFSAGDELFLFVPESVTKRFWKLKLSDRGTIAPAVITVYLVRKG